ncbi:hypothetical protein [Falsiroseomonas sp.]|uniref:hypothetical protein n=1 Tax=Falsiroseomonas sp. TaxID=2870721 RepID=UPI0035661861
MSFHLRGGEEPNALIVEPERLGATMVLRLPVEALPWRDAELAGARRGRAAEMPAHPLAALRLSLAASQLADRTGIRGAERLWLADGMATLAIADGGRLVVPRLRIGRAATLPASVQLRGARAAQARGSIHVVQLSAGRRVGGLTLVVSRGRDDGPTPTEANGAQRRKLHPALQRFLLPPTAEKGRELSLLLLLRGPAEDLEQLGLRLGGRHTGVVAVRVAAGLLPAIAASPSVLFVEPSRPLGPDQPDAPDASGL